jgi:type VI secretion system secreted protein Hcp
MLKRGFLTITRKTGGVIEGPSVYQLAKNSIEVIEMRHEVSHEYNVTLGTLSGNRKHSPFAIIKEIDMTTPLLNDICAKGLALSDVKLDYYREDGKSPQPVPYFSWTLTDAYIVSVKPIPPRELGGLYDEYEDLLEEVSFAYQHITWEHHAHLAPNLKNVPNVSAGDKWSGV